MRKAMTIKGLAAWVFFMIYAGAGDGNVKFEVQKEADHYRIQTKDWVLFSWASRSRTLDVAEQIEVVRTNVENILQVKIPLKTRLELRIFKDRESFLNFSKKDLGEVFYMGGYCSPERNEVVTYDHGSIQELLTILSHELTHYFTLKIYKSLPLWVNEGFADFVGFSRVRWGKIKGSEPSAAYLKGIRFAADAQTLIPLRELIQSSLYLQGHERDLQYAQFWGLVYFFLEGAKQKYRPAFLQYMSELRNHEQTSLEKFIKLEDIEMIWVEELSRVKTTDLRKRPKSESMQFYQRDAGN